MKYILLISLFILAACQPIADHRTEPERAATRTARPIQPLYEGRIRIVLKRPPVTIEPQVGVPDWEYTVTPSATKASE